MPPIRHSFYSDYYSLWIFKKIFLKISYIAGGGSSYRGQFLFFFLQCRINMIMRKYASEMYTTQAKKYVCRLYCLFSGVFAVQQPLCVELCSPHCAILLFRGRELDLGWVPDPNVAVYGQSQEICMPSYYLQSLLHFMKYKI